MRLCPICKKENELYRVVRNVAVYEDIFTGGILEDGYVDYTVADPEVSDDYEDATITYMCSYCQHEYDGDNVDDVYFKEMIPKEGEE